MTSQQLTAYALVLLMPLSVALPLMPPLAYGIHWLYVTPAIEPADIAAILVLFLALLAPPRRSSEKRRLTLPAIVGGLAVLAALSIVTALLQPLAVYTTARWALAAGVCWGLSQSDVEPRHLLAVLVGGLVVQSLVAFAQVVHQGPLGLPGELAMWPQQPGAPVVNIGGHQWLRGFGWTFHPNVLGGFLAVGLIVALPRLDRLAFRIAWWAMAVGLLTTFSRAAYLAAAFTVPVVAVWLWRRQPQLRRGMTIAFTTGLLVMVALGWNWRDRIAARFRIESPRQADAVTTAAGEKSLGLFSGDDRMPMNRYALQLIVEHPVLGIGAGNSPLALQRHGRLSPHYPHNVPLMLGAEVGLLGAALWLALLVVAVRRLNAAPARDPSSLIVGVAALVALQIIGVFDCYPWSLNAGRALTVVVLATIELAGRPQWTATAV